MIKYKPDGGSTLRYITTGGRLEVYFFMHGSAKEVIIAGTTLNVLPVVKYENDIIANGKPGSIAKELNARMLEDIKSGVKGTAF